MVVPELEKLAEEERGEFLRLICTLPFELTSEDKQKLDAFASKIDFNRYLFEERRERAREPFDTFCQIINRQPYRLRTCYGEVELPDELIPEELKKVSGTGYHADYLFAKMGFDLDTNRVISFTFREYLKKATPEELAKVPNFDSVPEGEWPKKTKN